MQESIAIYNLFRNKLNGGVSLAYPLLEEILILKAQATMKSYFDDNGDISDKAVLFNAGFQIIPRDDLKIEVSANFIRGDIDTGKTDVSGFSLGLIANYGF